MGYDSFSASKHAEADTFMCTPGVIPIYPVRFSLLPLEGDIPEKSPVKPTTIESPGSYIIRTLRQGYVYIFVENPEDCKGATCKDGIWHIFRYSDKDTGTDTYHVPFETETRISNDKTFTKLLWTDATGENEWIDAPEEKSRPYCWVPESTSKIWIAYSEVPWPPVFFQKAGSEPYRKQIMQPVNLRSNGNKWAAFQGEIKNTVEEFKLPSAITADLKKRLDHSFVPFSHTKNIPGMPAGEECVAIVSLFDATGDIAEIHSRIITLKDELADYREANKYALETGLISQAVSKMKPELNESSFRNKPALREGWEDHFNRLQDVAKDKELLIQKFLETAKTMMLDSDNWMHGKYLELAKEEAEADDIGGLCAFSWYLGRGLQVLESAASIDVLFKEDKGASSLEIWKHLNAFRIQWNITNAVFDGLKKGGKPLNSYKDIQYLQKMFNKVFQPVASNIAEVIHKGGASAEGWLKVIDRVFKSPNSNPGIDKVAKAHAGFLKKIIDSGKAGVKTYNKAYRGLIEKTTAYASGTPTLGNNPKLNVVLSGLGLLVGALAVLGLVESYSNLSESNNSRKAPDADSKTARRIMVTDAVVTTVAIGAFSASMIMISLKQTIYPYIYNNRLLLRKLGNASLLPKWGSIKKWELIAKKWFFWTAMLNAMYMSGKGAAENDPNKATGNAIVAGAVALLIVPLMAPEFAAGFFIFSARMLWLYGAAFWGGTGLALFEYDDLEDVMRRSFWGSNDEYWGTQSHFAMDPPETPEGKCLTHHSGGFQAGQRPRLSFEAQILIATNLGGTEKNDYIHGQRIPVTDSGVDIYAEEMQQFYDKEIETLEEIFYTPVIAELVPGKRRGDNDSVIIATLAFAEVDMEGVNCVVEEYLPSLVLPIGGSYTPILFGREYTEGDSFFKIGFYTGRDSLLAPHDLIISPLGRAIRKRNRVIRVTISMKGPKSGLLLHNSKRFTIPA